MRISRYWYCVNRSITDRQADLVLRFSLPLLASNQWRLLTLIKRSQHEFTKKNQFAMIKKQRALLPQHRIFNCCCSNIVFLKWPAEVTKSKIYYFMNVNTDVHIKFFVNAVDDISIKHPEIMLTDWKRSAPRKMHQPGFEPGSREWESLMLPLHHWCGYGWRDALLFKHLTTT